ncbi:MAG: hypothetical protein DWQ05_07605 [Calditrichaeota bacterium]|nr:MAG: hypothetical protein DWQ05_07605 [Calditrichota bacterium]
MRHIAFLSTNNLEGFVVDDELAIAPLAVRGWQVKTVSWRQPCDWSQFEIVIIRSTWDYQNDVHRFLRVLEEINASGAILLNDLELVNWNIEKTYLQELRAKGNAIVRTIWEKSLPASEVLRGYFQRLETNEIIIKPLVSANADFTYRLLEIDIDSIFPELQAVFALRPFMVQPFMQKIISEGEYSLFYFAGKYSHAILKTPKKYDFRVQEEHGGYIKSVQPEPVLLEQSDHVLASLPARTLYARLDFVRKDAGDFEIMEVELIEPALYFRTDVNSAERFAEAVSAWVFALKK